MNFRLPSSLSKRFESIVINAGAFFVQPVIMLIIARFTIVTGTAAAWAEFMYSYLMAELVIFISGWGAKDVFLLETRKGPENLPQLFAPAVSLRMAILVLLLGLMWMTRLHAAGNPYFYLFCLTRLLVTLYEPLWVAEQKFYAALFNELLFALVAVVLLFGLQVKPSTESIFMALAWANTARLVFPIVYFRKYMQWKTMFAMSWRPLLFTASPFFFAMISGFVQLRMVRWAAAAILMEDEFAFFDIAYTLLMYFVLFCSLLLSPFAPHIYRLAQQSVQGLQKKFAALGFILSVPFLVFFYLLTEYWLHIPFPLWLFPVLLVYCICICYYMLDIYQLQKTNKQSIVLYYAWTGIIIELVLCYLWGTRVGVNGFFAGMTVAQFFKTYMYHVKSRAGHA